MKLNMEKWLNCVWIFFFKVIHALVMPKRVAWSLKIYLYTRLSVLPVIKYARCQHCLVSDPIPYSRTVTSHQNAWQVFSKILIIAEVCFS